MSFQKIKQNIIKYAPYIAIYCSGIYWLVFTCFLSNKYSKTSVISNIIKYTVVNTIPLTISLIFTISQITIGALGCLGTTDLILENQDLNTMYFILYVDMMIGCFIITVSILYMTQIVVAFYCFLNFSIWLQNSHSIRKIKQNNNLVNQQTATPTPTVTATPIAIQTDKSVDIESGDIYLGQPCTKVYTASV